MGLSELLKSFGIKPIKFSIYYPKGAVPPKKKFIMGSGLGRSLNPQLVLNSYRKDGYVEVESSFKEVIQYGFGKLAPFIPHNKYELLSAVKKGASLVADQIKNGYNRLTEFDEELRNYIPKK